MHAVFTSNDDAWHASLVVDGAMFISPSVLSFHPCNCLLFPCHSVLSHALQGLHAVFMGDDDTWRATLVVDGAVFVSPSVLANPHVLARLLTFHVIGLQGLHAVFTGDDDTWRASLVVDGALCLSSTLHGMRLRRGFVAPDPSAAQHWVSVHAVYIVT